MPTGIGKIPIDNILGLRVVFPDFLPVCRNYGVDGNFLLCHKFIAVFVQGQCTLFPFAIAAFEEMMITIYLVLFRFPLPNVLYTFTAHPIVLRIMCEYILIFYQEIHRRGRHAREFVISLQNTVLTVDVLDEMMIMIYLCFFDFLTCYTLSLYIV